MNVTMRTVADNTPMPDTCSRCAEPLASAYALDGRHVCVLCYHRPR